jgi:hypothetical protein
MALGGGWFAPPPQQQNYSIPEADPDSGDRRHLLLLLHYITASLSCWLASFQFPMAVTEAAAPATLIPHSLVERSTPPPFGLDLFLFLLEHTYICISLLIAFVLAPSTREEANDDDDDGFWRWMLLAHC